MDSKNDYILGDRHIPHISYCFLSYKIHGNYEDYYVSTISYNNSNQIYG
jgi:hypothetical protein